MYAIRRRDLTHLTRFIVVAQRALRALQYAFDG